MYIVFRGHVLNLGLWVVRMGWDGIDGMRWLLVWLDMYGL